MQINNIASCGIIYRGINPSNIFLEIKNETHPIKFFRGKFSLIGGNWIGEKAKSDQGPLETLRRELAEELTLDKPAQSTIELNQLGLASAGAKAFQAPATNAAPNSDDTYELEQLKLAMCAACAPFGSFLNTFWIESFEKNEQALVKAVRQVTTLFCYWSICLREPEWRSLSKLQQKFGNLSNESMTLITSLDEIVASGLVGIAGHEWVLQRFFLAMGINKAHGMNLIPGQTSTDAGSALPTYQDYLRQYKVVNRP